ncbi:Nitrate reductase [NADPH] [Cytospora mali]|uniref:Nitrate reductase n=1 Tax=Cytospora mali TaxID=578113 RepID=A0A194VWC9_CYTMA|nr:Nitrate reductase [NADPH] [Valsa mali]
MASNPVEILPPAENAKQHIPTLTPLQVPPSPPATTTGSISSSIESETDSQIGEPTPMPDYQPYPLPPKSRPTQSVLPEDLKTPDSHVQRDPRLIRLTGTHPFNVEPPLTELWDEGFLTSKDLHYVRNHGAVPLVHDGDVLDWTFSIEGLVENPFTMTLRDLLDEFEQVTYPVTLVCAGNRRKEQNVVRKTNGFSWGAAGLATALWTGVPLDVLLAKAKPLIRGGRRARYVCFEGAERLPNGHYGTSIKLAWAMDPARGVLVAHGMNGEALTPDHGKPLRIIVPGQIGGRSVKWLKRIIVTAEPSDNWYHIYDNRVLPTTISPAESADMPDTWKDERYAIYDLNTNSAVARPAHDESVEMGAEGKEMGEYGCKSYRLQGYAYAGGGKRVTRVELTLDRGKSWRLADVSYPEDEYRLAGEGETLFGGKLDMSWRETCFCWCFWSLDIPIQDLTGDACTGDIMVRAMDEAMMVQPRDMYWSVLGMMNNPWYRVVIHREGNALRFEHPTQPALIPGGWMERVKRGGGNLTNGYWGEKEPGAEEGAQQPSIETDKNIVMVSKDTKRQISLEELEKHEGEEEPWFVLDGEVYDGTKFLEGHPGGAASITGAAGQDVTEEFMAIHSENAKAMMPSYHIGTLDAESKKKLLESGETTPSSDSLEPRSIFLHPKTWYKAALTCKTPISSDTKIFTFTLDHTAQGIGIPVGQHLLMRLRNPVTREAIIRAYTPLSDSAVERGKLDLLVKVYHPSKDGEYKGGIMTQALDSIPLGHWVEFKGPVGKFEYLGRGMCMIGGKERRVRRFVMICAGSGITPIFSVLRAVLKDPEDETHCFVLDGNRSEEDILCKLEMDALTDGKEDRCRLMHSLSRPEDGWTGAKGRMDRKLFVNEVGPPGKKRDELVMVCGPEPMERSIREHFLNMGWSEEDLLFF